MEKHFECDNCKKKYFRITSFEKHRTKCLNLKRENLKSPLSMDTLYQYILELKEQNKMLEDRLLRVEKERKQEKTNKMNIDLWIQYAFQNISLEELLLQDIHFYIINIILQDISSTQFPLYSTYERKRIVYIYKEDEWNVMDETELNSIFKMSIIELRKIITQWSKTTIKTANYQDTYVKYMLKINDLKLSKKKISDIQKYICDKLK